MENSMYDHSFRLDERVERPAPTEDPTMGLYYEELAKHGRFDESEAYLSDSEWEEILAR
jgi:hypothetical protein